MFKSGGIITYHKDILEHGRDCVREFHSLHVYQFVDIKKTLFHTFPLVSCIHFIFTKRNSYTYCLHLWQILVLHYYISSWSALSNIHIAQDTNQ